MLAIHTEKIDDETLRERNQTFESSSPSPSPSLRDVIPSAQSLLPLLLLLHTHPTRKASALFLHPLCHGQILYHHRPLTIRGTCEALQPWDSKRSSLSLSLSLLYVWFLQLSERKKRWINWPWFLEDRGGLWPREIRGN